MLPRPILMPFQTAFCCAKPKAAATRTPILEYVSVILFLRLNTELCHAAPAAPRVPSVPRSPGDMTGTGTRRLVESSGLCLWAFWWQGLWRGQDAMCQPQAPYSCRGLLAR